MSEQQLSESELRAYLEQLRAADVGEVVVQAYALLGAAAEAKLGMLDARMLIDAMGAMVQAVGDRVEGDLGEQMRAGVGQLQVAQVEAERQLAAAVPQGQRAAPPPATPPAPAAQPGPAPQQPAPPRASEPQQPMTDRLWIPGRGGA